LKVHPWYGQTVVVLRRHGRGVGTIRVEREDGEVRVMPAYWTDLEPRLGLVGENNGARLTPQGALELSRWIAARKPRA
jgi:hypothetical protein